MSDLVHLRLDSKTRKAVQHIVAVEHFASESDFIRDAIRKNIELYDKLVALKALQGSIQRGNYKPLPASEDIFRHFGLEHVPKISDVSRDDTVSTGATSKRNVKRVRSVR